MLSKCVAIVVVLFALGEAAEVLNVHLIAHSHDDVGWLKTIDQYYYGGIVILDLVT